MGAILRGLLQIGMLRFRFGSTLLISPSITVINSSGENIITEIAVENVFELDFSPLGTFIAGWQRPAKDEAGEHVHNLKIWRISIDKVDNVAVLESSLVGQFKQKSQNLWNPQYTHDELYCIRTVTNQIHIFETPDLRTVWRKLQFEGITDFAISSSQKPAIAVLQPERKVDQSLPSDNSLKIY